eukprot:SM000081S22679  [mRNA]  locus=s81:517876:520720:+ [translate_table: standard]
MARLLCICCIAQDRFRRQTVSCHWKRQRLAVTDARDRVLLYDLDDQDKAAQPSVLGHEFQRQVAAVAWRPRAGQSLATACRCVRDMPVGGLWKRAGDRWALGQGQTWHWPARRCKDDLSTIRELHACHVPDLEPLRTISKAPMLDLGSQLLRCYDFASIVMRTMWVNRSSTMTCFTAVLTSTSSPTFAVWDVATGSGEPLRRGFAGVSLVEWSPSGDYLFSAHTDATFHIWETTTWTSELWSSVHGNVVSARWSSGGKVILAAFENATTLAAIHLAGQPPSLDATLIPVDLPELDAVAGPAASAHQIGIERMAWDPTGQRLAVNARTGDASADGLIAIYDTRTAPIVSVSFIGFLRGHDPHAKPISFAFFEKIRWGALLAVHWSTGRCCFYPLLFGTS